MQTPRTPARARSYDQDRRQTRAELEQLQRKRFTPQAPPQLVRVEPESSEDWPVGTAWLDTSAQG